MKVIFIVLAVEAAYVYGCYCSYRLGYYIGHINGWNERLDS